VAPGFDSLTAALADRYQIEREIGQGGMATVYVAKDLKHDRQVAIKVLKPELAAVIGADRFLAEIKTTASLQHPHILALHDSGEAAGFLYFVMPYVEGASLRDYLERKGELPIADAVRILRHVVDALGHAHQHGLVHRDIKPDNVMLSGRHALVADFGVAKAVSEASTDERATTAGVALGTPAYMAPEQASAAPNIDHRADIYAVGVLAYELLTGRPPFDAATAQAVLAAHLTETPDPVTKHRATVPEALAQVVARCLEKKPADRWQTAEELLSALETVATPSGGMTPVATQPVRAVGSGRRRVLGVVAAAVVLAGAAWGITLAGAGGDAELVQNRVSVSSFANRTGDASLEHLGQIAGDWVQRGLVSTERLEILPSPPSLSPDSTSALLEYAESAGARLLVSGTYYLTRDSVRFQANIMDVADGRLRGALDPIGGSLDDPTPAIETLRERVMSAIAVVTDAVVDSLTRISPRPPNYAAYREWSEGYAAFYDSNFPEMKERAYRAMRLDPSFHGAKVLAANALFLLQEWVAADSILRNLESSREELNTLDSFSLEWFRGYMEGDIPAAARATRQYVQRFPDPALIRQVASDALVLNRPRDVIETLGAADPRPYELLGDSRYWRRLTDAHHLLGDYENGVAAAREGLALFGGDVFLIRGELLNLGASGRDDLLRTRVDEFASSPAVPPSLRGREVLFLALDLIRHERHQQAEEYLDRAISILETLSPEDRARRPFDSFNAYRAAGRWPDAAAFVEDVGLARFGTRTPVDTLGVLALLAADRGESELALQLSQEIRAAEDSRYPTLVERSKLNWEAIIAAALDRKDEAVEKLRLAYQSGLSFSLFQHLRADMIPLHGHRPYEELVRPKG